MTLLSRTNLWLMIFLLGYSGRFESNYSSILSVNKAGVRGEFARSFYLMLQV